MQWLQLLLHANNNTIPDRPQLRKGEFFHNVHFGSYAFEILLLVVKDNIMPEKSDSFEKLQYLIGVREDLADAVDKA